MKKYIIFTVLVCVAIAVHAQEQTITGIVIDQWGQPIYGASVQVAGQKDTRVETDRDGNFAIETLGSVTLEVYSAQGGTTTVPASPGAPITIAMDYAAQTIDIGADKVFTREQSTAAVSTAYSEDFNRGGQKNVSSALYGFGLGLTALQNSGFYADTDPTFYVRGLQGLNDNAPLVLVDGIERDMNLISAEEVESVSILKDAAAVALYGYKGSNGAILITTKRGNYNSREIKFTYDHVINFQARKPQFVDAATYATAYNTANAINGVDARYTSSEIDAYRSGAYSLLYPNVDWADEVFKNTAATNKYAIEFRGGGNNFRYYTMVDLLTDKGFIDNARANGDYSTQNKYTRANVRTNWDVDLTPTTKMKVNLFATLTESLRPGDSVDLWALIYDTPANAFPIYGDAERTIWGGNTTGNFLGTANPVAQSQGAGYTKGHNRGLYSDITLSQDLSGWLKGLSVNMRLAYDTYSSITEDHSKTYSYQGWNTSWSNGTPTGTETIGGEPSELGKSASTTYWARRYNFFLSADYANSFGKNDVYGQVKYTYEYSDTYGLNTTKYTQDYSLFGHYAYDNRYVGELALMAEESSRLAPKHKWSFSPTISAAWVISNEKFMKNATAVDFLKLRASWGIINSDYVPYTDAAYWEQSFDYNGGGYRINSSNLYDLTTTVLGTLATLESTHEKTYKYNVGIDATFFHGLNVTLEGYYQRRTDQWVSAAGKYTDVMGFTAPYENAGIVDSWGVELGIDYSKKINDWTINIGGNFSFTRNKIVEQLEEPRAYDNLITTGHRLNQIYGMQTIGFIDQADLDAGYTQEFGTLALGDLKYADINGDGTVNSDDTEAIGYSSVIPEIYFSFHLGAEWKGLGITALFQGAGNYSAMLSAEGLYRPYLDGTNLSQYYYDNCWNTQGSGAIFPRLVTETSNNNYRNSTTWLVNRTFLKLRNVELYYNFPKELVRKSTFIDNARVYVRGENLFSADSMNGISDPETYNSYTPSTWGIVFGLTIGF